MKIASIDTKDGPSYGAIIDRRIRLPEMSSLQRNPTLKDALASDETLDMGYFCGAELNLDTVTFLPVVPNAEKILCVGVNYRPHIEEMGRAVPEHPVVFLRVPGSMVGHERPLMCPTVSEQFDYEGELAIIVGRRTRYAKPESAMDAVFGITCFMDGSVRDWQRHTQQFTAGKNFPESGSCGPWAVPISAISDIESIGLTTRVNGEVLQRGRIAELVFDIPAIVAYCSTFTELMPGDIIATGTPGGVGAARRPPRWLTPSDVVEVDIDGIGVLRNRVVAESSDEEP